MVSQTKRIILCADDFGLNSGVSEGILKLAQMGRLSAVSCMVNMPCFSPFSKELIALRKQVSIGLHFNLTEGFFLSSPDTACFSLKKLLIQSHLSALKLSLIVKEFTAQLDQFVFAMGFLPDFIDGHQHVHQFPFIRKIILDIYQQRLQQNNTYIRSTWPIFTMPKYQVKSKILTLTGGKSLQKKLQQAKIPHNAYFAGVYDFDPQIDYRALFRGWLSLIADNTLIMCHPSMSCSDDYVTAASRFIEFDYLISDAFLQDCEESQVQLILAASPIP